ncbi:MAG: efflux RND transporter periplasmic adaptor subunit [Bacteroidales bacterium]
MKNLIENKWITGGLILLVGLTIGILVSPRSDRGETFGEHADHQHEWDAENQVWTCSMHPQIRQDGPGDCPICGMDLIPVSDSRSSDGHNPMVHEMSAEAIAMANILTSIVRVVPAEKEISLSGNISFDEQTITNVTSQFPGRVEQLYVNFTGQQVNRGDPLASVYSPELVTAQQELFEAVKMKDVYPALYTAAREKLRLWRLSPAQIDEIESSGEVQTRFRVLAGSNGIVTGRTVTAGDYVGTGTVMFEIADLNNVWVKFDAYESDLAWINTGDKVNFTVSALPGEEFSARVTFIDPVVDPRQRTASVRAEAVNRQMKLKPGMFVNGRISSDISAGIHEIAIPRSAILWSGRRSVVYVKVPGTEYPEFEMREIILGQRLGEMHLVESGLDEGEEIVTNGVFTVDAAAQLSGNFSMMTRPEAKTLEVPQEFSQQLTEAAREYFKIANSLVESDPVNAMAAADDFLSALGRVDMGLLEDEPHVRWMDLLGGLSSAAGSISSSGDLDEQRVHFETLSDKMIESVEYFGLQIERVYKMHCPMAFDDKGADWLSENDEILNPYFGDMMLRCGEKRETYRKGSRVFKTDEDVAAPAAAHQH